MYIDSYRDILTQLCLQNKVKSLYAFGSVLTSRFNNDSDIDMIVDIDSANPIEYADCYFNLKFALQDLFNRPIDLFENKTIRNDYLRREIDNSKQLIYASTKSVSNELSRSEIFNLIPAQNSCYQ
ncbi:MAG: nucleotidyltransferase domain-containing protein [Candidatus Azobacteroides sp.]|nr:nucleotidyltransferase domain-containing protein [Candidatus Azobacteroides sp.]